LGWPNAIEKGEEAEWGKERYTFCALSSEVKALRLSAVGTWIESFLLTIRSTSTVLATDRFFSGESNWELLIIIA
jgi:hypothetical protein